VPQLYGWKGANPALAMLLRKLKKKGFHLVTVAHEFSVPFEWPLTTLTLASAHRILFRAIVGASHQVIATTNFCLNLFQKSFPRHKSIFHYIPISSTVRRFPEENQHKSSIRSKLGIDSKELLIATFGFPIGDALPLFQAVLSRILQTQPASRFLFLGEPSHRLKSMFKKDSELESRIIATGTLSEEQVSNYLSASDLYVLFYPDGASTRRTTLMAGLSHGVPTVSNLGVLTDASLASSGAALLLKDGSERELNALDELIRNPNIRKNFGATGRNYYEKNLSILKAAEKYSELFRSLDGNEQVHP
jgi:glycosyltransferase involved in cell wall biosynthesis